MGFLGLFIIWLTILTADLSLSVRQVDWCFQNVFFFIWFRLMFQSIHGLFCSYSLPSTYSIRGVPPDQIWHWMNLSFCDVPFRGWAWHLHGFISWSTGQPNYARGNDWQTAAYISSKADGEKELEFSQSICCYGFCILGCWMCCWEGLMDLIIWGMEIYIYIKHYEVHSSYHVGPWFFFFQARAKHDITNTVVAGCATGGAISAKGNTFFLCFPSFCHAFLSLDLTNELHKWPGKACIEQT